MSRIIDILTAIQAAQPYNAPTYSRAEAILKDIANGTTEFTDEPMSRYEELLICLRDSTTTTMTAQTRLETILIALCNDTPPPTVFYSELEAAYVNAFIDVLDAYQIDDTLYLVNVPATQNGEVLEIG